jgi:hypothetical protein
VTWTAPSLVALGVLASLAPRAAAAEGRGHARERHSTCAVVEIGSDQAPRAARRFRATRVVELEFEVELLRARKGEKAPQLRLYTPDGFLYQVLETREVRNRWAAGRYRARLPVAGTSIVQSGLYGRWRVVPHASDAREACGHARGFVIRP